MIDDEENYWKLIFIKLEMLEVVVSVLLIYDLYC